MIRKLIQRFLLWRNPPKTDDVYWTDSFTYLAGRPMEHVLHGLRDKNGNARAEPVHGPCTYRMTIRSDSMSYYVVQCEVLAANRSTHEKLWAFRVQPRRIDKKIFVQMILDKEIKKYEEGEYV